MRFKSTNDFWLVIWLVVCGLIAYGFAEEGMRDHWSILRWITGVFLFVILVGPLFAMAYLRWFGKD